MAIAVAISCINALTLSPALCALIMTPHAQDGDKLSFSSRFHMAFDAAFQRLITKYKAAVEVLFRHRGGKAEWVYVHTVNANSESFAVTANTDRGATLNEGDEIIVSGNLNLADGSTVIVKKQ